MTNHSRYTNPFPGFNAYSTDYQNYYFIPQFWVQEIVSRLTHNMVVTLIGERGNGKTSLVNSAMVPMLSEGYVGKGGSGWDFVQLRPGADPYKNIAIALTRARVFLDGGKREPNFTDRVETMLKASTQGLINVFEKYPLKKEHNLLIYINDFEDIFAFKEMYSNKEEGGKFIQMLMKFIRNSTFPVYLVLSLSSEFLNQSSQYSGLPEVINNSQYMIPKMDYAHLQQHIGHALNRAGIPFDMEWLSNTLTTYQQCGVSNYQLQYFLRSVVKSWLAAGNHTQALDSTTEKAIGALENIIEKDAEKIYLNFTQAQQKMCAQLFKSLVYGHPDGYSTVAISVEEIANLAGVAPKSIIEVISAFEAQELSLIEIIQSYDVEEHLALLSSVGVSSALTLNQYSKITLRYSGLINQWKRLNDWVIEEQKNAETYLHLSEAASLYNQGNVGLLTNPELERTLTWFGQASPSEIWAKRYNNTYQETITYLQLSEKHYHKELQQKEAEEKKHHQMRRMIRILTIGTLTVVVLLLAFWLRSLHSNKQKIERERDKIDLMQNIDSVRVIYTQALRDLDSAYIDRLRLLVYKSSYSRDIKVRHIYDSIQYMIRQDSLCKRGIKYQIKYADHLKAKLLGSGLLTEEEAAYVDGVCDALSKNCTGQLKMINSIDTHIHCP